MLGSILLVLVFGSIFLIFYGHYRFYHGVGKDKHVLFNHTGNTEKPVAANDLKKLPDTMVNYLKKVDVIGSCKDCHATIKQRGQIRKNVGSKWLDFTAKQYMSSVPIGFIWAAKSFPMFVKDKSVLGIGETNVSLFGLFSIAKERSKKINESALGRCLAELPLYPVAFLNNKISFKALDENKVRAVITIEGTTAEGIFHFDANGLIERFQSKRYRGTVLERFTGEMGNYKTHAGLYVPTTLKAIWNLEDGDFHYFTGEIVDYQID